jgi:hypothetical protein
MPCCVGILRFIECQHNKICKICCTTNYCDAQKLCPPGQQRILVAAKYKWSCQDCVDARHAEEDEKRYAHLIKQIDNLEANVDQRKDVQAFNEVALRDKARVMESTIKRRRLARATELEMVERWMWDFALTSFEILYHEVGEEDGEDADDADDAVEAQGQNVLDQDMDDESESAAALDLKVAWLNKLIEIKSPDLFIIRDATGTAQEHRESQSTAKP